ncbi:hypothetical protein AVEN_257936-1, partial [Araneus ventricosus]
MTAASARVGCGHMHKDHILVQEITYNMEESRGVLATL